MLCHESVQCAGTSPAWWDRCERLRDGIASVWIRSGLDIIALAPFVVLGDCSWDHILCWMMSVFMEEVCDFKLASAFFFMLAEARILDPNTQKRKVWQSRILNLEYLVVEPLSMICGSSFAPHRVHEASLLENTLEPTIQKAYGRSRP